MKADVASMAGATNSAYGIASPWNSKVSISWPTPMPIENR